MGRRVCPSCNYSYNIAEVNTPDGYEMEALLPKKDINKCDNCNVDLIIRDDDKEDVIRDRMVVYQNQTKPILDFFESKKYKVVHFEAKKGIKDYPKIKDLV